ncbi:MAG TPA: MarR family transcriptional regulator [Methylomirabilota bacterium]|nr:MarR family transcriptional regulator [Methylomirabilota bacterium]
MSQWLHRELEKEAPKRLAALLGATKIEVAAPENERVDVVAQVGAHVFAVECKSKVEAATIRQAALQARNYAATMKGKLIPLVAVPYMGEVGRAICEEAGVCWIDLSGNAHIADPPRLLIHVEGKPNLFKQAGRPRSVFAPKSARIARVMLVEPDRAFSQSELATASGLDKGFTSKIVRQLEEDGLVAREADGRVRIRSAAEMLEDWRAVYDFSKHRILRGHVAARSGEETLRRLDELLLASGKEHAATGLAAAWLLNGFAGFRLATFYVEELPEPEALGRGGFRAEERGSNAWLVVPNDAGVFYSGTERQGMRCVHPVQAYLDLKGHPERAKEATEELRKHLFSREANG